MTATTLAGVREGTTRAHVVLLGIAWLALGMLFARDVAGLAGIWWTSSAFNHCLLIPPIIAWLVWLRWPELARLAPRGWLPGLAVVGAGAAIWLAGEAAGVALARHLGLVLMLQGAVVTILGPEVARGLMFPLAYMFFLVPMGEGLVPPLQTLTARFAMALLTAGGIPAHLDGVFITIPNGRFEVAEACSGVTFLMAMAAYGALVANVCFRRWTRRIIFITAALLLSVAANGIRAWGTIYIAHRTSVRFAEGFDHIVYGWVFFGLVIALLMVASWRWFDRPPGGKWLDETALRPTAKAVDQLRSGFIGVIALPAMAMAWSLAGTADAAPLPDGIALPEVPGWTPAAPPRDWRPSFAGADRLLFGRYVDGAGHGVDLAIAIYAGQSEGRELVGYGQGAVPPDGLWAWTDDQPSPPGGRAFRITGPGGIVRDVICFYRIGGVTTGSEARVKIETLRAKMLGGSGRAAGLILAAPETGAGRSARPVLESFLAALGPVDRLTDHLAGGEH